MGRPTEATVKKLYLLTSNRCAFPECVHPLATPTERSVAEVCHICADQAGGPRYDPQQTEKERQSYENLIVLCANHHLMVDGNETTFTADVLRDMKRKHESKSTMPFVISDRFARDISFGIGGLAIGSVLNTFARELGTLFGTLARSTNISDAAAAQTESINPRTLGMVKLGDEQYLLGRVFKYPPRRFTVESRGDRFVFVAEGIRFTLESRGWKHSRAASWIGLGNLTDFALLLILEYPYPHLEADDEVFIALSEKLVEVNQGRGTKYHLRRYMLLPEIAGHCVR